MLLHDCNVKSQQRWNFRRMERQTQDQQTWGDGACAGREKWPGALWSGCNAHIECARGDCGGGGGLTCPPAWSPAAGLYVCTTGKHGASNDKGWFAGCPPPVTKCLL
jgi:hypothetical protein